MVPKYSLAEVRLRSENITTNTGFAKSPELWLKVAEMDEPARIRLEEDALNRVYAFFMALEMHGCMKYAWSEVTQASEGRQIRTGGALDFLLELEASPIM